MPVSDAEQLQSPDAVLIEIAQRFETEGEVVDVEQTGLGNVNDTYLVTTRQGYAKDYFILQRLNGKVFTAPDAVMHNLQVITEHVHQRLETEPQPPGRHWQIPRMIFTTDNTPYLREPGGGTWRALTMVANATAHETIHDRDHAREAGVVLGHFHRLIANVPPRMLQDPLPGFHETTAYLDKFDSVLATDFGQHRLQQSAEAQACRDFIRERREWASVLEDALERGDLQLRPIHGDPKAGNVMIDNTTGKGICMIDLDTVKPSLIHYDFGDCLRSCCNPAGENPGEVAQVKFDLSLCKAIVEGYMETAADFLTDSDRAYLYDSIRLLAYELALRFLTDHIAGDQYFKIRHPGHNLRRARVQMRLCESIEAQETDIRAILDAC